MKKFWILYWVLFLASGMMFLSTGLFFIASILTLGLAIPGPTIFYYLIALLPGMLIADQKRNKVLAMLVSFVLVICFGVAPHFIALQFAKRDTALFVIHDFGNIVANHPRSIELAYSGAFNSTMNKFSELPCHDACQTLLINGEVDFVDVSKMIWNANLRRDHVIRYTFEKQDSCTQAFGHFDDALDYTKFLATRGDCIVAKERETSDAALKVTKITIASTDWKTVESFILLDKSSSDFVIPLAKHTTTSYSIPTIPAYLTVKFSMGIPNHNYNFGSEQQISKPISELEYLQSYAGFQLKALPKAKAETNKIVDRIP